MRHRSEVCCLAAAATWALSASAVGQTIHTWSGADVSTNNYWNNSKNWINNAPSWGSGYTLFPSPAPVTTKTADMNGVAHVGLQKLTFETSGYLIEDKSAAGTGSIRFDNIDDTTADIISMGAGINRISAGFAIGTATGTKVFDIASGNHLVFSGSFGGSAATIQGGGTMVISSPAADTARNFNANYTIAGNTTLLFNSIEAVNQPFSSGTFGGTGGILTYGNNGTTTVTNATFRVGGDGVAGNEIGTFTFRTWDPAATGRWNVAFDVGTIVQMQIGAAGNNDKVMLELAGPGLAGCELTIKSGVTLDLFGTTIPDGSYVLFENVGSTAPIIGTFSTVRFNGAPINPSNFTMRYNGSNIAVDVVGMSIPEPATIGIAGIAAIGLLRRRRR